MNRKCSVLLMWHKKHSSEHWRSRSEQNASDLVTLLKNKTGKISKATAALTNTLDSAINGHLSDLYKIGIFFKQ